MVDDDHLTEAGGEVEVLQCLLVDGEDLNHHAVQEAATCTAPDQTRVSGSM